MSSKAARGWHIAICAGLFFPFFVQALRAQDSPPPAGVAPQETSAAPSPLTPPPPADKEFAQDPYGWYLAQKKKLLDATGTTPMLQFNYIDHELLAGPAPGYNRSVLRYELNIHQLLWTDAEADFYARGGTGDGLDKELGSTLNTDQYETTQSYFFILHFWMSQKLFDGQLTLRGGKIDIGDFMDTNRYAFYNFLGYSLAHNPSIPLPGNPLGGMFTYQPKWAKDWYLSIGATNANESSYVIGLSQTFSSRAEFFTLGEIGVKTHFFGLEGNYRVAGWFDPRNIDYYHGTQHEANRSGVSVSFDQDVTKNIGLFMRYGTSNTQAFTPMTSFMVGADFKHLIPGRPHDDIGMGYVQNIYSRARNFDLDNSAAYEGYLEAYYNAKITGWLTLQPALEVVANPGGLDRETAVSIALHVQVTF